MKDVKVLSIQALALQGLVVSAWQAFPRQAVASNSTIPLKTVPATATLASSTTVAPCCWIAGQFQGVRVNTWASPGTQYVATIVTTFLRYNGTIVTANSTTISLPESEIYTNFGVWGPGGSSAIQIDQGLHSATPASIPGVPTTLVPDTLITGSSEYGATIALPGNKTFATFPSSGQEKLTIYSPTPYAVYKLALLTISPDPTATAYNPTTCGTSATVSYVSYTSGTWQYVTKTEYLPDFGGPDRILDDMWGQLFFPRYDYQYVVPLPAPPPNYATGVSIGLPTDASSYLVHNTAILNSVPWITNCFTAGGTGQPTAKVPVNSLTASSSEYYDIAGSEVLSIATATVFPSPRPATQQATPSTKSSEPDPTTDNQPQSPSQKSIGTDQGPAQGSAAIAQGDSRTTITPPSRSPDLPGPVTTRASGSTKAPIQPVGPSAAVVGGTTLTIGGPPITESGKTLLLISQSGGVAVVIDGTTTQQLQAASMTDASQLITVARQTLTIGAGAIASQVVVDGITLQPGSATVINGETISVTGTYLIIASGSSTTTQGLGDLILGGLGASGSATASTIKTGPGMPSTGAGAALHPRGIILGGLIGMIVLITLLHT